MFDFLTTDVDRYLVCMFARHGSEHEVSCTGSLSLVWMVVECSWLEDQSLHRHCIVHY